MACYQDRICCHPTNHNKVPMSVRVKKQHFQSRGYLSTHQRLTTISAVIMKLSLMLMTTVIGCAVLVSVDE